MNIVIRTLLLTFCLLHFTSNVSAEEFNQSAPPKPGDTVAIIKTGMGTMKAKIFKEIVPNAAQNFIELAEQGKYKKVSIHRVVPGFVIQSGDFTNQNGTGGYSAGGPNTTIEDEYSPKLTHIQGALSWAKTSEPRSIGSQFFIVTPKNGTHSLDHTPQGGPSQGYTVFGQLYDGYDVLKKISETPTGPDERPTTPVFIESVTIESFKK